MKSLITARAELQAVQGELKARRVAAELGGLGGGRLDDAADSKKSFTELLAHRSKADEVVREMSRLAVGSGGNRANLGIKTSIASVFVA